MIFVTIVYMCGIFGYTGTRSAQPLLIEGLQTLEYRGYDSAGIYTPSHGCQKAVGPIKNLVATLKDDNTSTSGIAHTRWATHGLPTLQNAHPHMDASEQVWIAHNGIIENWEELKEGLRQRDIRFYSDTDTEVLAKLIGIHYKNDLRQAILETIPYLRGAFGIIAISKNKPDTLVAVRYGSPLVVGLGTDGNFISSDASAILPYTREVIYLNDGDIATITPEKYSITTFENTPSNSAVENIDWDVQTIKKDGYDHYMLKEIHEAPKVIADTLRGRTIPTKGRVRLGGLESVLKNISEAKKITITGCGSAHYAGLCGSYLFKEHTSIDSEVILASEYRYTKQKHHKENIVLAISQSGETADTLAAIKKANENKQLTLGIVNTVGSTIARETKAGVYNHAGPEIAVASTKAFISQLTVLALITILLGREGGMKEEEAKEIITALECLPDQIQSILNQKKDIEKIASDIAKFNNALFIGRHSHMPIAYEGALKLKEVAYIHAEAYAGGELKHGPIALLDESCPIVALAPQDHVFEKIKSNIEEARARKAPILTITTDTYETSSISDWQIHVPKTHPVVQPILSTIPLHLLAYYVGVARGHDVDKPRNLAKSVTVE